MAQSSVANLRSAFLFYPSHFAFKDHDLYVSVLAIIVRGLLQTYENI